MRTILGCFASLLLAPAAIAAPAATIGEVTYQVNWQNTTEFLPGDYLFVGGGASCTIAATDPGTSFTQVTEFRGLGYGALYANTFDSDFFTPEVGVGSTV